MPGHARQLRLGFLAIMLLLASTLGWLGWRLLEQDRQLSMQRLAEQRDAAADLAVATLEMRFSAVEQDLNHLLAAGKIAQERWPADGAVFVQLLPGSIRVWPESGLVYYPELTETPEAPASLFDSIDELEFKKRDHSGAITALRNFTNSGDARIRAAAFVRIARNYFQNEQPRESLKAYAQLADLGHVPVAGMPAALAGRAGMLAVFARQQDHASLVKAARDLNDQLNSGQWRISAAIYQSFAEEVRQYLAEEPKSTRIGIAEAVEWLYEKSGRDRSVLTPGRTSLATSSGPVLLVWRVSGNAVAGFAAGVDYIETQWLAQMMSLMDARRTRLALTQPDGTHVLGDSTESAVRPAIRLASITGLPWTVQVLNTGDEEDAWRSRRLLLAAGMGTLLVLILTVAWFIGHTVSRELAVARLKSDFVSAVSHEFRTPLTTLCQLSELLKRGRVAGEEDRRQYYELLHAESRRLRRLVESLLNFGRLEAGQLQFHFEQLDAASLVSQSAAEFAEGQQARGYRFQVQIPAAASVVRADREMLHCVLWNLFENAVKYSPESNTVRVSVAKNSTHVEIAVQDRGLGIPKGEQRQIFEKFVRGSAARNHNIGGTGIGLAMAREIVRAHGGDITVESEPGKGSTFRVLLPWVEV